MAPFRAERTGYTHFRAIVWDVLWSPMLLIEEMKVLFQGCWLSRPSLCWTGKWKYQRMAGRTEPPLDGSLFLSNEALFFVNVSVLHTQRVLLVVFFYILVSHLRKKLLPLSVSLSLSLYTYPFPASDCKQSKGGRRELWWIQEWLSVAEIPKIPPSNSPVSLFALINKGWGETIGSKTKSISKVRAILALWIPAITEHWF